MKRSRLVLLLCIFTAFVLWLLYTLSNEYSSYFRFPLEVETNLEGRTNLSMAENTLFLKGKARGFYIIRSSLRKRPAPVRLFVDQSLMREYPGVEDEFYVLSDDVHNLVNEALGADLLLENIFSDTIRLNYTRVLFKKVPVVFISDISYRPQYMSFNPPRIIPDSVLVYASASLLPLIDHVKTRKIYLMELDQTVDGLARLEVPQGTRLSHKEISYELTVERYVELMFQVPVETRNVPFRKELLLLPDVVTLQFRCPFQSASSINEESFSLIVDYNRFMESGSGKTIPQLEVSPSLISHLTVTPEFIDGIIQNK